MLIKFDKSDSPRMKMICIEHLFMTGMGILLSLIVFFIFSLTDASGNSEAINNVQESALMTFFHVIVIVPTAEEFFYRLVLYDRILRKKFHMTHMNAAIISSVIFGTVHTPAIVIFVTLIMGVILCSIYNNRSRITYCIAFHAGFNFFSFVVSHIPF